MNGYKFIWISVIVLITWHCTSRIDQVNTTLNNYQKALVSRDTSLLLTTLSPDFRTGIHQRPIADKMVKNLFLYAPKIQSVSFGKIQNLNNGFKTQATYYITSDSIVRSDIYLSHKGQIQISDYFDQVYQFQRYRPSAQVTTIPFALKNGSIMVQAQLNDQPQSLNMLFDTGADGMALKSSLIQTVKPHISKEKTTRVPGGKVTVKFSTGNTLQLNTIKLPNQNMVIFDNLGRDCDAILGGANLFRNYITKVDFDTKQITLYTHGQFAPPKDYVAIDLNYSEGIPIIPFHFFANNKQFRSNFVFDTGAHYDAIMFGPDVKKHNINKYIPTLYSSFNHSPGKASQIDMGQADSLVIAGLTFPNVNLAMERYDSKRHANQSIKGSLGIELLRRMNWIVDLTNYKIYFKPNAYFQQPLSFRLSNYIFELTMDNRLLIKQTIGANHSSTKALQAGDEIIRLNSLIPDELSPVAISELANETSIDVIVRRNESSFQTKL